MGKMNPIPRSFKKRGGEIMIGESDKQMLRLKYRAPTTTFGSASRLYDPKYYKVEN